MTKVVFFDAAGTLIEPREPVGRLYAQVARRFGVEAPEDAIAAGFRRAFGDAGDLAFDLRYPPSDLRAMERRWWRGVVAATFAGLGEFTDFDACFSALYQLFAQSSTWVATPGAIATLDELRRRGLALGVISNFDYRLYGILEGLGLSHYLDSITISSEAGYAKPTAGIFRLALARHDAHPNQALHVGDSEQADLEGAAATGLAAALLDRSVPDRAELRGRRARIGSLPALIEVLAMLDAGA